MSTQLNRLRRDSFDQLSENLVTRLVRLCVGAGVLTGKEYNNDTRRAPA